MNIDELYPYWPGAHEDFVDRLRYISDEQWEAAPSPSGVSIRQIVQRFMRFERFWMQHIAQSRPLEPTGARELRGRAEFISEMEAIRAVTIAYLDRLPPAAPRSVRVAPADPATNEIQRNVPLSWIIWHLLEEELMTYGQVRAIIEQTAPLRFSQPEDR